MSYVEAKKVTPGTELRTKPLGRVFVVDAVEVGASVVVFAGRVDRKHPARNAHTEVRK